MVWSKLCWKPVFTRAINPHKHCPWDLTTFAAAPRGPSRWMAHPEVPQKGSPGCSARSTAITRETSHDAPPQVCLPEVCSKLYLLSPAYTFLFTPSDKVLTRAFKWSCSLRAFTNLRNTMSGSSLCRNTRECSKHICTILWLWELLKSSERSHFWQSLGSCYCLDSRYSAYHIFTLLFITAAKLQLWSSNKIILWLGGPHDMMNLY